MKNKLLKMLTACGLFLVGGLSFAACDPKEDANLQPNADIYAIYVMAESNGYTGTYEEWLESIKGAKGDRGDNIQLRVENGYIQWKTTADTTWENLISIDELKGDNGQNGTTPTVEISDDGYWVINGVESETKAIGENGNDGQDYVSKTCVVTYNFNLNYKSSFGLLASIENGLFNKDGFVLSEESSFDKDNFTVKYEQTVKQGDYFNLYSFKEIGLAEYFNGWYYNDIKIENINVVADDIELEAKWKEDVIMCIGTPNTYNVILEYDDETLTATARPVAGIATTVHVPELVLYENKIYTVTDFIRTTINDTYNYEIVQLPKTISNSNIKYILDYQIINEVYFGDVYYLANSAKHIDGNFVGYIGDYVFVSVYNNFALVYKVNWEDGTAELYKCSGTLDVEYNNTIYIQDFKVMKDGQLYSFKVTQIDNRWFGPNNIYIRNGSTLVDGWSGDINDLNLNIVVCSNVKYFYPLGQITFDGTPRGFNAANLKDLTYYIRYNLNIFYENHFDDLELDPWFSETYPSVGSVDLYIYKTKEPTEQERQNQQYWHYVDGVPTIWTTEED